MMKKWIAAGRKIQIMIPILSNETPGLPMHPGASASRKNSFSVLALILLFGFALRAVCALFFKNVNHTDEIFQYIEPAHRLVFGYGMQTWEFVLGGRSWLVPGLSAGIIKLVSYFSTNPAAYLGAIGLVMSALSLVIVVIGYNWGQALYGRAGAIVTGVIAASWFELVYYAPKPLTDVLAGNLLILSLFLVYPNPQRQTSTRYALAGFCLGLAFAIRFQMAPIYGLAAIALCRLEFQKRWLPLVLGALVPILAAGFLDWVTWGYPFKSILLPLWRVTGGAPQSVQNIEPFYYYIGVEVLNWSGASVFLVLAALIGARRMPLLAVLSLAIFLVYSIEPIKTYRYFYPALALIVILAGLGTSEVLIRLNGIFPDRKRLVTAVAIALWPISSAALAVSDHFQIYLHKDGAVLQAFDDVGKAPEVCGVATVGINWSRTGGYTHLHRNVPIYEIDRSEVGRYASGYNYMISQNEIMDAPGYVMDRCTPNKGFSLATQGSICVYRRPGPCAPLQSHQITESLKDSRSF